jgi:hypothetical protein
MDFFRKVTNSNALKNIIDLPESLWDQDVELIILPIGNDLRSKQLTSTTSSPTARGALKQYANLDLMQHEQEAWEMGVKDKYEHR